LTLNNSTVSGNSAKTGGGGLYNAINDTGLLALNYSTVANNTSDSDNNGSGNGGGINNDQPGTATLQSSIVAGNKKGPTGTLNVTADCSGSGTMISQGFNLTGSGTGCGLGGAGDVTVTPANVFTNVLGVLANNGGPTKTHALLPGSPAIDAGNDSICAADPINGLDQRGVARPQGPACDIGAYELILPVLNFPQNGYAPPTTRPLFDWANADIATSYSLQISTNQNFTSVVVNALITPSAYMLPTDLPRNTLLFWRVRANGPGSPSGWSRVRHFDSANPPGVPALLAPANGGAVANGQPTLDWSDSMPLASYYEVQISTDPNFATILGRGQGGKVNLSQYTPEAALGSGKFYWRVRAVSGGADGGMQFSQWSAVRSFNVTP